MKRPEAYAQIEGLMLKYVDYLGVPAFDCGEPLVPVNGPVEVNQIGEDMRLITGDSILVRQGVMDRLRKAAAMLSSTDPTLCLQVVYGYRTLTIQKRLFQTEMRKLARRYSGLDLAERTHRRVASPDVAGHPTGGAVDIQIVRRGNPLDFGTKIWDFKKDSYVFSPFVSEEAQSNRQLLRSVMLWAGFAPFDGEWWHFSYGDKEWAKYYGKKCAIYEQVQP